MGFPTKKVYGDSKITECPFCGKQAITRNPQNVPVCKDHDSEELPNMNVFAVNGLTSVLGNLVLILFV